MGTTGAHSYTLADGTVKLHSATTHTYAYTETLLQERCDKQLTQFAPLQSTVSVLSLYDSLLEKRGKGVCK